MADDTKAAVVEVLESVLFANMVGLVTGARSPADIGAALERAVRTILGWSAARGGPR